MLKCSSEAFAKCPTRHICGNIQEATFMEGSECDLFNRSVADKPMTNGDWIRALTAEEQEVSALVKAIRQIAAWAGFEIINRIEFRCKKSGRCYR